MFGIPANWLVAGVLVVVGLAWAAQDWLIPVVKTGYGQLGRLWGGSSGTAPSKAAKMNALELIVLAYRPLKNTEVDAALKTLQAHFFDEAPGEA